MGFRSGSKNGLGFIKSTKFGQGDAQGDGSIGVFGVERKASFERSKGFLDPP